MNGLLSFSGRRAALLGGWWAVAVCCCTAFELMAWEQCAVIS